jgi:hypothetical protein
LRLEGERRDALFALVLAHLVLACGGCERKQAPPEIVIVQEPGAPIAPSPPQDGDAAPRRAVAAPAAASKPFAQVSGPGYQGYVRPAQGAEHWEPTAEDIAALEERVPAALARAVERGEVQAVPLDLSTYARQYYGYVKDESRLIEVRFFCESARHLAAADVHISGGGSCFWKTVYDARIGRFLGFKSNAAR